MLTPSKIYAVKTGQPHYSQPQATIAAAANDKYTNFPGDPQAKPRPVSVPSMSLPEPHPYRRYDEPSRSVSYRTAVLVLPQAIAESSAANIDIIAARGKK